MTIKDKAIKAVTEYFDRTEPSSFCGRYKGHQEYKKGVINAIEDALKKKSKLSPLSQRVGRSESYYEMSGREQWAEDKAKGILDWDGTKEWLDRHGK